MTAAEQELASHQPLAVRPCWNKRHLEQKRNNSGCLQNPIENTQRQDTGKRNQQAPEQPMWFTAGLGVAEANEIGSHAFKQLLVLIRRSYKSLGRFHVGQRYQFAIRRMIRTAIDRSNFLGCRLAGRRCCSRRLLPNGVRGRRCVACGTRTTVTIAGRFAIRS